MSRGLEFRIVEADIASVAVDVLALKYAQAHYGLDKALANKFASAGALTSALQLPVDQHALLSTHGVVAARELLVIGVPTLRLFSYDQIQQFTFDALSILARERPAATRIALTLHGAGFGLDEIASFQSELAGLQRAWSLGHAPTALTTILLVEQNTARCKRLRQALRKFIQESKPSDVIAGPDESAIFLDPQVDMNGPLPVEQSQPQQTAAARWHAFVAMPYSDAFADLFHYGIEPPVHQNNLLCERVDQSTFTGDIVEYMRGKIETASVFIGVLTNSNPNVYLEVGYAWGKGIPTILAASNVEDLQFDVKGQKCLAYQGIVDLEGKLNAELKALQSAGRLSPHR